MMKRSFSLAALTLFCIGMASCSAAAQQGIDAAEKQTVIDSLSAMLEETYVFPDVAKRMSADLKQRLKSGGYQSINDAVLFADRLTQDLQAISHDKHLRVNFNPAQARAMRQPPADGQERQGPPAEYLNELRRNNFGFKEVKILEGNVGYLDLRGFNPASLAGETAAAVMNYFSNADGIIFDLRQNGGGDPGMIQLLTSYLYAEGDEIHLNNFYYRPADEITQTWTLPYVPGKRNPNAKVYVLTSSYTFSAAEEFTYNLKNLQRATIVGETTGGGAHPGGTRPVADRFVAFVPIGRAINPISKTNWEGTGVEPDVKTPAEKALETAHLLALEDLRKSAKDEQAKGYFEWNAAFLKARLTPVVLSAQQLQAFAGSYGERSLIFEGGKLYYQRVGRPKMELYPLTATTFAPVGRTDFRIGIEQQNGNVSAMLFQYSDGRNERNERTKA